MLKYIWHHCYRANQSPFDKFQFWIFVKVFWGVFSHIVHLMRESHTPQEYMESIFMTTVGVLVAIVRVSTLFKNDTIFIYIDTVEKTINESEFSNYQFNF